MRTMCLYRWFGFLAAPVSVPPHTCKTRVLLTIEAPAILHRSKVIAGQIRERTHHYPRCGVGVHWLVACLLFDQAFG